MFIFRLRKGISVIGLIIAIGLPWLITHWPDLVFKKYVESVAVPPFMQICRYDGDCSYVETACSACCRYQGINKAFADQFYQDKYNPACVAYHGAVCDCVAGDVRPACVQGKCALLPP